MAKFMVLYSSNVAASDLMAQASQEEMDASMAEWMQWRDKVSETMKVDFGMPLQIVGHITPEDVSEGASEVGGYSIIEGDSKEAVLEQLTTHPQLKREGSYIDVFEMLAMPGM